MAQQPVTIHHLRQIRTITKNYPAMRGLQGVPVGLFCFFIAAFQLYRFRLPQQWSEVIQFMALLGFVGALALYPVIGNFYDRRFGCVRRAKRNRLNTMIMIGCSSALLLAVLHLDNGMNLPVSATGLYISICFFVLWLRTDSFRMHILMLALLLTLMSFLPLLGFASASKLFLPANGGFALAFGLLLTVGGLCDHLLLLRTFKRQGMEATSAS